MNDPGGPTAQTPPDQSKATSSWEKSKTWMVRWRGSRQLVLVIVAIALLLDNMLLTVVGKWMNLLCSLILWANYQPVLNVIGLTPIIIATYCILLLINLHDTEFEFFFIHSHGFIQNSNDYNPQMLNERHWKREKRERAYLEWKD